MGILGPLLAAKEQSKGSEEASKVAASTAADSIAEQRRQYDTTRADLAPYRETGYNALGRLNSAATGDMSSFQVSPDYNFVRSEGNRDIGNSFAAKGGAASGNALRALSQYNANLASGEFGNWWNRQAGLAGVGQNAVNTGGIVGQNSVNAITGINTNAANMIGTNTMSAANARASGINNAESGTASTLGYFFGKKK